MSNDNFGDFSLNTSSGFDNFDSSSWGPSFDSYVPTDNYDYSSSLFDSPNWFTSQDWNVPDTSSIFSNPDWLGSNDWSTNLDSVYDPLSDPGASTSSITDYINSMISNPDLYSLTGGGNFDLGEGSNILGLNGDNVLGSMLNSTVGADSASASSTNLTSLVKAILGGANKAVGGANSAMSSPLGQLAKVLLATMAKRDSIKNQRNNIQTAQQLARTGSQQGLTSNRTGLLNMNTDSRDPMSYVQQAPTIQR